MYKTMKRFQRWKPGDLIADSIVDKHPAWIIKGLVKQVLEAPKKPAVKEFAQKIVGPRKEVKKRMSKKKSE